MESGTEVSTTIRSNLFSFREYTPWILGCLLFVVALNAFVVQNLNKPFSYSADDPYIHMAIAKNLTNHSIFGVTPFEYSSASSSPFWTILLNVFFKLFGISDLYNFYLNLIFSCLIFYQIDRLSRFFSLDVLSRCLIQLIIVLFVPIIPAMSSGMENTMHAYSILLLMERYLLYEKNSNPTHLTYLALASIFATASRYETAFLLIPIGVRLLTKRQIGTVAILAISSLIPVVIFGTFSIHHGGSFFPDSMRVKQHLNGLNNLNSLSDHIIHRVIPKIQFFDLTEYMIILFALSWVVPSSRHQRPLIDFSLAIMLIAFVLHAIIADFGAFFRYELYLLAPIVGLLFIKLIPRLMEGLKSKHRVAVGGVVVLTVYFILLPMWMNHWEFIKKTPQQMDGTYDQQHQMSNFIKTLPAGTNILIGDIGVVCFKNDALRIVDINGLATHEIADSIVKNILDQNLLRRITQERDISIGLIYRRFYEKILPPEWYEFGMWLDPGYCAGGDRRISFFCMDPSKLDQYRQLLLDFSEHQLTDIEYMIR